MQKTNKRLFETFQNELQESEEALRFLQKQGIPNFQNNEIGFCPKDFGLKFSTKIVESFKPIELDTLRGCIIFPTTNISDDILGFSTLNISTNEWFTSSKGQFQIIKDYEGLFIVATPLDALILNSQGNSNVVVNSNIEDFEFEEYLAVYQIGPLQLERVIKNLNSLSIPTGDFKSYFIDEGYRLDDLLAVNEGKESRQELISDGTSHSIKFHNHNYQIRELNHQDTTQLKCKIQVFDSKNPKNTFSNTFDLENSRNRSIFSDDAFKHTKLSRNTVRKELQTILDLLDEYRTNNHSFKESSKNTSEVSIIEKEQALEWLRGDNILASLTSLLNGWNTDESKLEAELALLTLVSYTQEDSINISFDSSDSLQWKEFNNWIKSITPKSIGEHSKKLLGKLKGANFSISLKPTAISTYSSSIKALKSKQIRKSTQPKIKAILSVLNPIEVVNTFLSENYIRTLNNFSSELSTAYLHLINSISILHQFQRSKKALTMDESTVIDYLEVQELDIAKANELFPLILAADIATSGNNSLKLLSEIKLWHQKNPTKKSFTKKMILDFSDEIDSRIRHGLDELCASKILQGSGTKGQTKTYRLIAPNSQISSFPFLLTHN